MTIEHQEVASTLFKVLLSNEKKIMQNAIKNRILYSHYLNIQMGQLFLTKGIKVYKAY